MRERPILFNGPMVRATLAGTKRQTRRGTGLEYYSNPANDPDGWWCARVQDGHAFMVYKRTPHEYAVKCPYGQPGDRLWVRETWNRFEPWTGFHYAADYEAFGIGPDDDPDHIPDHEVRWRPSIHMPRAACRIVLEITRVRLERLQQISDADCWAEGIEECDGLLDEAEICRLAKAMGRSIEDPQPTFAALWDSINGPGAWDANPWVWVVEFRQVAP